MIGRAVSKGQIRTEFGWWGISFVTAWRLRISETGSMPKYLCVCVCVGPGGGGIDGHAVAWFDAKS